MKVDSLASKVSDSPSAINRAALATGAAVFLGSATILMGALALGEQRLRASLQSLVLAEQREALSNSAHSWSDMLSTAADSARLLRQDPRLQNALAAPSPAANAAATQALLGYVGIDHHVIQARLLGRDGREQIRIHGGSQAAVVPDGQLQDKSQHDYFRDGIQMPLDAIHVSALNHNRERGAIDYPLKPTLRITLPVPTPSGAGKAGLLVINFDAQPLLQHLKRDTGALEDGIAQAIVVDQNGAFLRHPQPQREWGFELQELNQLLSKEGAGARVLPVDACALSLACSQPALWKRLQREASGQLAGPSGLWSWTQVDTRTTLNHGQPAGGPGVRVTPRRWWLISHTPAAALQQRLNQKLAGYWAIGTTALALSGALSLLLAWFRRDELLSRYRLKRQHRAYSLLAENAADVVLALHQGRITWVSASISRYSSTSNTHWLQRRGLAFVHPQQRRQVLEAIARLPLNQSTSLRLQVKLQSGRYDWIALQARHVANEDGIVSRPIVAASFHLINEQIRQEEAISYLAAHDELTGLLNRRAILEQLEVALASDEQRDPRMALLFVDLDAFKAINDTYGHADGDLVLRQTAERMRRCVRTGDSVGRLGGDELLVVLQEIHSVDDAMVIAHQVHRVCSQPVQAHGYAIHTSVSVGVALGRPGEGIEALQARADQALYRAKAKGRNRVILIGDHPGECAEFPDLQAL